MMIQERNSFYFVSPYPLDEDKEQSNNSVNDDQRKDSLNEPSVWFQTLLAQLVIEKREQNEVGLSDQKKGQEKKDYYYNPSDYLAELAFKIEDSA
jgi:hypothetical protein